MAIITSENTNSLHQTLRITLEEKDYNESYKKTLLNTAKKVRLPGFRTGKVPAKVVEKIYGKSLLTEELLKIAQNKLFTYLQNTKTEILYQPLLVDDNIQNKPAETPFIFIFEIGLRPEIDLSFLQELELKSYKVYPNAKAIQQEIKYSTYYFAEHKNADTVSDKEKDRLIGHIPSDKGEEIPLTLYLKNVTEESFEKKFKPITKASSVTITINDILPEFSNHYSHIFSKENDKKEIPFLVKEIKKIVPHALNEELYEKVFPNASIKTEEAFTEKLKERIQNTLDKENKAYLAQKLLHILQDREAIVLPTTFIQKWEQNHQAEKKEPQTFTEKDWQELYKAIRYHLIEQEIVKNQKIVCTQEELSDFIKNEKFKQQFAQYNLPENTLNQLLTNALADPKYTKQARQELTQKKAINYLLTQIRRNIEEVDNETFLQRIKEHFETSKA